MSLIRVDNFGPSAGGTTYSARGIAKAWVNFNGQGTVAIYGSMNTSSLTDNGTGDHTVNFTSAMSDQYFAAAGQVASQWGDFYRYYLDPRSASYYRLRALNAAGTAYQDCNEVVQNYHGDLA